MTQLPDSELDLENCATFEIIIYCNQCGKMLRWADATDVADHDSGVALSAMVEPCPNCCKKEGQ